MIGCAIVMRGTDVPEDTPGRELWGGQDDWVNEGWATIVDPQGEILAGPLKKEEGSSTRIWTSAWFDGVVWSSIRSVTTRGPMSSS